MSRTQILDRLFQLAAVIVCGGCLLQTALLLAACSQTWDPCGLVAAVLFAPPTVTLGIAQYLALTRRQRRPAWLAARILGLFVLLMSPLLVMLFFANVAIRSDWGDFAVCVAFALFCGAAAWLNERRAGIFSADPQAAAVILQFSLRELALGVTALAVVLGLMLHFIRDTAPEYAENVSRAQAPSLGLPPNAREVTYRQSSYRGPRHFEFTTDEPDFKAWIADRHGGATTREITRPERVRRCTDPQTPIGDHTVEVTEGLFYFWKESDHVVNAVYDRKSRRAYYYSH